MPGRFGGPMVRGPVFRRHGFGWFWWGFGTLGILLLFARLALLLLPFVILGALLYAIMKR